MQRIDDESMCVGVFRVDSGEAGFSKLARVSLGLLTWVGNLMMKGTFLIFFVVKLMRLLKLILGKSV